ncbi:MAG: Dyp-type peroxidase [Actinobacteria bacterium]|nr:MAG: Dyp-type peroxidase [Actinomycetota bacterium]
MERATRLSRRGLLRGGAAAAVGAAAAAALPRAARAGSEPQVPAALPRGNALAEATVDCHGPHQAGIEAPPQAHGSFVAFRLREGVDRPALARLLNLWSDDIARLTAGRPALADPVPELAAMPAALTVTVGFGPGFFDAAGLAGQRPAWLAPLPGFQGDALDPAWCGGDLIAQVCADDPVTLSHTVGVLAGSAASIATVAWQQGGFQRAAGLAPPGTIGRNLMGFVDGIINPRPGTEDFAKVVWSDGAGWLAGGTGLIVRRIRLDLKGWSALSTREREQVFGRRASDGAPITGGAPTDAVDLGATDARGLSTVPAFSHVRLAAPVAAHERILRRPYNYDAGLLPDGTPDRGLIFAAYASDPSRQFVPIQQRLAAGDLLNRWAVTVGSAVFAVPPGFAADGQLGEALLG